MILFFFVFFLVSKCLVLGTCTCLGKHERLDVKGWMTNEM